MFARHGYFQSQVADVARDAGVAAGTVYLYFRSKDDLLVSIFERTMREAIAEGRAALAGVADPRARLRCASRASTSSGSAAIATSPLCFRWSCGSRRSSWSASRPPTCATTSATDPRHDRRAARRPGCFASDVNPDDGRQGVLRRARRDGHQLDSESAALLPSSPKPTPSSICSSTVWTAQIAARGAAREAPLPGNDHQLRRRPRRRHDGRTDRAALRERRHSLAPARSDAGLPVRASKRPRAQTRSAVHPDGAPPRHDGRLRRRACPAGQGRLDHRGGRRAPRHQAAVARQGRRRLVAPGSIVSSNTSGIPIGVLAEGRSDDFRRHWLGHALLQSAALSAPARGDPDAGNRSRRRRRDCPIRRPASRQGRGGRQGHAELHRQPHRALRRRAHARGGGERPLHDRRDRRDHRTRARAAGQRDISDDGYRRRRHPRARHAQPRRAAARRGRPRGLCDAGVPRSDDRHAACSARRPASGFYERRKTASGESRNLDARPRDARISRRSKSARIPSLEAAKSDRRRARSECGCCSTRSDKAGQFLRETLAPTLVYTARVTPDIAHSIDDVDRVMRWGFGWELGPFELFDTIGVREVLAAARAPAATQVAARQFRRLSSRCSTRGATLPRQVGCPGCASIC